MPRPPCCRRVSGPPIEAVFKPAGTPMRRLEQIAMTLDELEAIKLADLGGLYQEEAAARMEVSRPTFGRILASAHRKVAEALVEGKALRIEGGAVTTEARRCPRCDSCHREGGGLDEGENDCPRCRCARRSAREQRAEAGSIERGATAPDRSRRAPAKEMKR